MPIDWTEMMWVLMYDLMDGRKYTRNEGMNAFHVHLDRKASKVIVITRIFFDGVIHSTIVKICMRKSIKIDKMTIPVLSMVVRGWVTLVIGKWLLL